ncbi:MAG: transcriptional repressor LexA [Candidatus Falkowbacteria bacterium]|nr:MAG: transcriptional repressor LexA [Candidatus Falkowbacteria bacterium]
MSTLTKKQKQIYDFIREYTGKYGYAPSLTEIGSEFGVSTVSTIHKHISNLIEKGLVKRIRGVARSIELVGKQTVDFMAIPIIGTIAAGKPIEAIEVPDDVVEIAKDRRFQDGDLYALRVKGNSMIGDGIFDGDIAIIKKQEWADNGDTAVAIIDDNEATLKKFYKEKGRIRLQPANPTFQPIFRKHIEIRGIAVKIIRDLARY